MIETLPLHANGHRLLIDEDGGDEVEVVLPSDGREPYIVSPRHYICAMCGQWPTYRFDADAVRVQDPCPIPDGITTTVTLNVPSGKLIVSDDLRPVYDWDDTDMVSYNTPMGQAQAVEAMAAVGCAYGPTGNLGLGLYRTGADTFIVATPDYDEDEVPSLPESDCAARICTDLWAYSIADFEHWKARGGDPSTLGWGDTVVEVPAGTYRFVYHGGERGFDRDAPGTVVWADVERVA